MPSKKERLDKLLVDRGLCATRAQAQALIMAGNVKLDGQPIMKAGTLVACDLPEHRLHLDAGLRYVSRGGLKLEKALDVFELDVTGQCCLDIGASTGGFTDCLLQRGAARIVAVDVGFNQLAWALRTNPDVLSLEKTHIAHLIPEELVQNIAEKWPSSDNTSSETIALPSVGVVDTSFISLRKVLPSLSSLMQSNASIIALIKPQFEYKDYSVEEANFKGVVKQAESHVQILNGLLPELFKLLPEWRLRGLDFSPITGPKGNVEFLLWLSRGEHAPSDEQNDLPGLIQSVVEKAHLSQHS